MPRLVAFLLALVLAIGPVLAASPQLGSIQMIGTTSGGQACTIFSIHEQRGYWMTARHCVQDINDPEATVYSDLVIAGQPAWEVKENQLYDLVLVQSSAQAKALKLELHPPKIGDETERIGIPHAEGWLHHVWGRISQTRIARYTPYWQHSMVIDGLGAPGMSGSPIFSKRGRVISVHQGARRGMPFESLSVPWDELVKFALPYWER